MSTNQPLLGSLRQKFKKFVAALDIKVALVAALILIVLSLVFPPRRYKVLEVDLDTAQGQTRDPLVFLTPAWTRNSSKGVRVSRLPALTRPNTTLAMPMEEEDAG